MTEVLSALRLERGELTPMSEAADATCGLAFGCRIHYADLEPASGVEALGLVWASGWHCYGHAER